MSTAKIANRMARTGRNSGRRAVGGGDALERFRRPSRRISRRNPNGERAAAELAREFHGRPVRGFIEIDEPEVYSEYGAVLGELMTLDILMPNGTESQTIRFDFDKGGTGNILVVAPNKGNIEFVGGDQDFNWWEIEGATQGDKHLVLVGPVCEIDYFADKHHLDGPEEQKQGITYFHEFGEGGGELPLLLFDTRNKKLLFAGGDYTIEPEGITG